MANFHHKWSIISVHYSGDFIREIRRIIGPYDTDVEAMMEAERMTDKAMPDYHQPTETLNLDDTDLGGKGYVLNDINQSEPLCGYLVMPILQESHRRDSRRPLNAPKTSENG